jgi:hypothetical protein
MVGAVTRPESHPATPETPTVIRLRFSSPPRARSAPVVFEMDPLGGLIPIQLIIYDPGHTIVQDGVGEPQDDGSITIVLPDVPSPPVGTPVQVVIYDGDEPLIIEGLIGPALDGFNLIEIPNGMPE